MNFKRLNAWVNENIGPIITAVVAIIVLTSVVALSEYNIRTNVAQAEQPLQVEMFLQTDIDDLQLELNEYLLTVPPGCVQPEHITYVGGGGGGYAPDNGVMVVRTC